MRPFIHNDKTSKKSTCLTLSLVRTESLGRKDRSIETRSLESPVGERPYPRPGPHPRGRGSHSPGRFIHTHTREWVHSLLLLSDSPNDS